MENAMSLSENFKVVNDLSKDCCLATVSEADLILNFVKTVSKRNIANVLSFLEKDCAAYSEDKRKIYRDHDIDNTLRFNIFESISDKWRHENFHSDILFTILNPDTREIGRTYFAEEFVKFLGVDFDCTKGFEVTREEGRIDLLIKNDSHAIIIENKINYAPDMENQLVRYMKKVKEEYGREIAAVVYLTLMDDKKPPLSKYDEDFKKYADMLQNSKILKEVCAVSEDKKKGLAKGFLQACLDRLNEEKPQDEKAKDACNLASVYIKQYKMLLEHLGGKAYMKSADKKVIEEIYSGKDKFDAANDLMELWKDKNRRATALYEVLKEKLKEAFPKKNWTEGELHNWKVYYCSNESIDDVLIYYCSHYDLQQIGFVAQEGKKITKDRQNELEKIINKIRNKESVEKGSEWVFCNINDTADLFKDVIEGLNSLFSATSE
ncbi:MAG: PD-(D/E)XK nuclease family protein [Treponemataceae bacterium]|nr:PD-(D/E)XK nuclease family protein [Treponemataceae bacterium]